MVDFNAHARANGSTNPDHYDSRHPMPPSARERELLTEIDALTSERDELLWRLEEAAERNRQESYHNLQSGTRG